MRCRFFVGICRIIDIEKDIYLWYPITVERGMGHMRRLLIAERSGVLAESIQRQLELLYDIQVCTDGLAVAKQLCDFDPDILLLDMNIPGLDGFGLLESLAASGRQTAVLALLNFESDYILTRLGTLGVKCAIMKPCNINYVVSHIRQVDFMSQLLYETNWNLDNETEQLLLNLGFAMGRSRYSAVCQAIVYKYAHFECQLKEVYLSVAKNRDSTATQIEKAIRDAISDAYKNGDPEIWRMYFIHRKKTKDTCPTSDEFIARIADCLRHKTKFKKPYIPEE